MSAQHAQHLMAQQQCIKIDRGSSNIHLTYWYDACALDALLEGTSEYGQALRAQHWCLPLAITACPGLGVYSFSCFCAFALVLGYCSDLRCGLQSGWGAVRLSNRSRNSPSLHSLSSWQQRRP